MTDDGITHDGITHDGITHDGITHEAVSSEAAAGPKRRLRRWPFAAAALGLVLLAGAVALSQHERTRADRADRAAVTARAQHDQVDQQKAKAQSYLAAIDATVAYQRRALDVDAELKGLEAVHTRLRADMDQEILLDGELIAAMPNPDVTEYNRLVQQANAERDTTGNDLDEENRLEQQLGQQSCLDCSQPSA